VHGNGWSRDLSVDIGGRDVINDAGAAVLRLLADRTGLTDGLSRALARRGFRPVHDRGRVLADTAVLIADGGRVMSDLATLRDRSSCTGRSRPIRHCGAPLMRSANRSAARSLGNGRRPALICGR
jgi:hypothetical protein